jgi:hypothetical protein
MIGFYMFAKYWIEQKVTNCEYKCTVMLTLDNKHLRFCYFLYAHYF